MSYRESHAVAQKDHPVRRRPEPASATEVADAKHHPIVGLQQHLGNARISRLIAERQAAPEDELMAKHDTSTVDRNVAEVGLEGGQISDQLSGRIQAKRGGGSALDGSVRTSMEQSFGTSFADVRVHADDEADALNRSVSAKAFTTGNDIFFSRNASPSDSHLIAHELTHVVQQRSSSSAGGPMTVGPAGDSHEVEADSAASSIASGAAPATAQRQYDGVETIEREAMPEEEMPM